MTPIFFGTFYIDGSQFTFTACWTDSGPDLNVGEGQLVAWVRSTGKPVIRTEVHMTRLDPRATSIQRMAEHTQDAIRRQVRLVVER